LAILTDKINQATKDARQRLHQIILISKPETVLCWHRELVRHKWTFKRKAKPGRPGMSCELEVLIVSMAKENPHSSWRSSLEHCKDQILACAFFTLETMRLKTICGLFFIDLGTQRVHLAGGTPNPDTTWVTQ
jgi:hypothetical protein